MYIRLLLPLSPPAHINVASTIAACRHDHCGRPVQKSGCVERNAELIWIILLLKICSNESEMTAVSNLPPLPPTSRNVPIANVGFFVCTILSKIHTHTLRSWIVKWNNNINIVVQILLEFQNRIIADALSSRIRTASNGGDVAKVSMTIADFDGVMYNVQNPDEENPNVITVSLKHSSFHQFEDHGATVRSIGVVWLSGAVRVGVAVWHPCTTLVCSCHNII